MIAAGKLCLMSCLIVIVNETKLLKYSIGHKHAYKFSVMILLTVRSYKYGSGVDDLRFYLKCIK
jgi:hypothetical protein